MASRPWGQYRSVTVSIHCVLVHTYADEAVGRLEALRGILAVVHESKARRAAATKVRAHAEHRDLLLGRLIELAHLFLELSPRHIRTSGVDHLEDHLPALKQTVADELAGPQSNGRVRILVS